MRSIATRIASVATCFTVAHHADIQATVKDGGSVIVRGEGIRLQRGPHRRVCDKS